MTPYEIARLRLNNQGLVRPRYERPEDVVGWLGAVQAQDYAGAKWGLFQRMKNSSELEIDGAFDSGTILRTHLMRPTWHFVTPEDIRWILTLTAPRVQAVNAHYYRQLELDQPVLIRSLDLIASTLEGGRQKTRAELGEDLEKGGVRITNLRLGYMLMFAELEALICSGGRRGKQFTYALLDERVPRTDPIDREEALAELVKRFFQSHGPATLADFAWWSGLTIADAKIGFEMIQPRPEKVIAGGRTYWFASAGDKPVQVRDPVIHLLPNYDELLISHRDQFTRLDPAVPPDLNLEQGALIAHIIARNGLVSGGWRRTIRRKQVTIEIRLLVEFNERENADLRTAAEAYGRYLGLDVILEGV